MDKACSNRNPFHSFPTNKSFGGSDGEVKIFLTYVPGAVSNVREVQAVIHTDEYVYHTNRITASVDEATIILNVLERLLGEVRPVSRGS